MSQPNNASKPSKIRLTLLALALTAGFFCWGLVYSQLYAEPEVIILTTTKYINHYTEVPVVEKVETFVEKRVIKEVPVIRYIEVEKEVPVELQEFATEEDLATWLNNDKTDELPYIRDLFECENFARTLIRHALEDNYSVYFQVLKNYTKPDTREFTEGPHAINSAIIGNYIYFIDPQTDEFWVAYKLE